MHWHRSTSPITSPSASHRCEATGIPRHRIVVDPGFGFGKTAAHNFEIMARLTLLHTLGCGVLIGVSRKSTIGRIGAGAPVAKNACRDHRRARSKRSARRGHVRVHDVAETKQAIAMWQAIADGA